MEFGEVSRVLKGTLSKILDCAQLIDENQIKDVVGILINYAHLNMEKSGQIRVFLDNVLHYFVLLNRYAKQFSEISASQHYIVRMALSVFVFVIETAQICHTIINFYRKAIDILVVNDSQNCNIKEFLRIYSHMLDKTSVETLQTLAVKHKAYSALYKILKETSDIEAQAIIMEVVLKLLKHSSYLEVDNNFGELIQNFDVNISKLNIYQNIRMILDHLNEDSTNIFSINCSTIELDSNRITEFYGAGTTDDIWLDINLLQNKISFFCDKNFVSSVHEMRVYSYTTWEVLSFCTKDILKIAFDYNISTENLILSMELKTSSFDLFASVKTDTLRKLEIAISRSSDRFKKLIEVILPKIFVKSFSPELLDIPKMDNDLSRTPSILSNNSADDSSPIIEHFRVFRKMSTRENSSPVLVISDSDISDSDSVVLISNDKNEELRSKRNKIVVFNGNLSCQSPQNIVSLDADTSKRRTNLEKTKISEIKPQSFKVSADHKEENLFNKSVSPLSFTESVFARPSSRSSKSCNQSNVCKRQRKFLTLDNKRLDNKHKISIFKNKSKTKISSSLYSPVIKKESNDDKKHIKNKEKPKEETSDFNDEEQVLEKLCDNTLFKDNLNSSISKVANWLKKMGRDSLPTTEIEKEVVELSHLSKISDYQELDLPSVSPHNTGRSSNMPPEERIEILMRDEINEIRSDNLLLNINKNDIDMNLNHSSSVTDLLKILTDDNQVAETNHDETNKKTKDLKKQSENDDLSCSTKRIQPSTKMFRKLKKKSNSVSSSEDGDIPLSELAKKWKLSFDQNNVEDVNNNLQNSNHEDISKTENKPLNINVNNFTQPDREAQPLNELSEDEENAVHDSVSNDHVIDKTDDDVTPDLEQLVDTNSKNKEAVFQNSADDSLNISAFSDTADVRTKKPKRKLYNPGDLSVLNATITEEYLKSRDNKEHNEVIVIKSRGGPNVKSKKQKSREKKLPTKTKNTNKSNKKQQNAKSTLQLTKNDISRNNVRKTTGPFTKSFNSLKQKIRDMKHTKTKKRAKGRHGSSTSSSSMVPFGDALNDIRKRKSTSSAANLSYAKRQKEERKVSNENDNKESSQNQKIRIISNVLIQPGSSNTPPQDELEEGSSYEKLVKMTNQFYLQFIKCVEHDKPNLLRNGDCRAIASFLQGYANKM